MICCFLCADASCQNDWNFFVKTRRILTADFNNITHLFFIDIKGIIGELIFCKAKMTTSKRSFNNHKIWCAVMLFLPIAKDYTRRFFSWNDWCKCWCLHRLIHLFHGICNNFRKINWKTCSAYKKICSCLNSSPNILFVMLHGNHNIKTDYAILAYFSCLIKFTFDCAKICLKRIFVKFRI